LHKASLASLCEHATSKEYSGRYFTFTAVVARKQSEISRIYGHFQNAKNVAKYIQ
jgi:hypothetical protein